MKSNVPVPLHVLVTSFLIILFTVQSFDFFYFVMQEQHCRWPARECIAPDFYIHGLWPNRKLRNRTPFNKSKVSHLICELQRNWPDLGRPEDSTSFWKHEWKEHGNCSWKTFDQSEYFQAALDLKKKKDFNLLRILTSRGIEPDNLRVYAPETISEAIENETGFTPDIRCKERGEELLLLEIHQCVDPSGQELIDCNRKTNPSKSVKCDRNITFPRSLKQWGE